MIPHPAYTLVSRDFTLVPMFIYLLISHSILNGFWSNFGFKILCPSLTNLMIPHYAKTLVSRDFTLDPRFI